MTGKHWTTPVGIACLLALAFLAYAPGLDGGFLFDDFVNLNALGATGPVDDWPTFWRYLSSGSADPTGRPVAMLSFLLDARDWPADPGPFLRTNVAIHLANGLLLILLLRRLGRMLAVSPAAADAAALLAGGAWLLHPLLVSTTLYVVQRQSMLSAGFGLAGLLAYVCLRERHARDGSRGALLGAGLALAAATALSFASKANGVLVPLLALALEATMLRRLPGPPSRELRALRWIVLGLPALVVCAYLASFLPDLNTHLPERGWNLGQRLLSEPRALASYLQLWFVPRAMSSGLYNDAFVASTSLLSPATTLPALLLLAVLVAGIALLRDRQPALAAAIAFFLAGHLLESSIVPIELYFEHRNYLPAALLFWPLALALVQSTMRPALRGAIAVTALLVLALTTAQRAQLWSQPEQLAKAWAFQSPGSSRAQATAAMMEASSGHPRQAIARLEPLWRARPMDLQLAFNLVSSRCDAGALPAEEAARLEATLAGATQGLPLMNRWLGGAIDLAAAGSCPGLDTQVLHRWLAAMARNPGFAAGSERDQELEPLLGRLALREGRHGAARRHFDRALRAHVSPGVATRQAAEMARAGAYAEALAHLDEYERLSALTHRAGPGMARVHEWVLERQGYWPREIRILRGKLRAELAATGSGASP